MKKAMIFQIGLVVMGLFFLIGCATGEATRSSGLVARGDTLYLFSPTQGNAWELVEYLGADAATVSPRQIRFKQLRTGADRAFTIEGSEALINLNDNGYTNRVELASTRRNPAIRAVDYLGDGVLMRDHLVTRLHYPNGISSFGSGNFRCSDIEILNVGDEVGTGPTGITMLTLEDVVVAEIAGDVRVTVGVDGVTSSPISEGYGAEVNGLSVWVLNTFIQDYAGGENGATLCINW